MFLRVVPVRRENQCFLRDEAGNLLPLAQSFDKVWKLSAVCGGQPAAIFAEWNGETLLPLSVRAENEFIWF
jgi:hypothetical protein